MSRLLRFRFDYFIVGMYIVWLLWAFLIVGMALAGSPLENELTNDPLSRGYSAMTDQQIVDSLNTKNRTRNRTVMTSSEVANQINVTEFNALTNVNEAKLWNVLHLGEINPFGVEATIFVNVFGGGSITISNLQVARVESISRAQELGIVNVKIGQIEDARP